MTCHAQQGRRVRRRFCGAAHPSWATGKQTKWTKKTFSARTQGGTWSQQGAGSTREMAHMRRAAASARDGEAWIGRRSGDAKRASSAERHPRARDACTGRRGRGEDACSGACPLHTRTLRPRRRRRPRLVSIFWRKKIPFFAKKELPSEKTVTVDHSEVSPQLWQIYRISAEFPLSRSQSHDRLNRSRRSPRFHTVNFSRSRRSPRFHTVNLSRSRRSSRFHTVMPNFPVVLFHHQSCMLPRSRTSENPHKIILPPSSQR